MTSGSADPLTAWFERAGARRRYPAQCYVMHELDEPSSVMLVDSGLLRIERTTVAGRRVLLEMATPGDLVGELAVVDDSRRSTSVASVVDTVVVTVGAAAFRDRLATDAGFSLAVLRRVVRRLRSLSDQYLEVTATGAAARVAARLVQLVEIAGSVDEPIELVLPFPQEDLARWAGLSREGTVKGLRALRAAGVLGTGRQRMTIFDIEALRQQARRTGH